MKNWLSAVSGAFKVCFMPTTPRLSGTSEISAFSILPEPPAPVPVGSPVSATNPLTTL